MNLGFGSTPYGAGMGYATVPSYDQLLPMQPPKRSWQSRLYDRMMPDQQGPFAVGDDDKKKLMKQGLLQLGIGLLQHNNLAQGLGAGLQGGLLSMQEGAHNMRNDRYQQQMMARTMAGMDRNTRMEALQQQIMRPDGSMDEGKFREYAMMDPQGAKAFRDAVDPRVRMQAGEMSTPGGGTIPFFYDPENPTTSAVDLQGRPLFGGGQPAKTGAGPVVMGNAYNGAVDPVKDFPSLAGVPGVQVSSLYRDPAHNAKVGGVPNSYHTKGQAGDFVVPPEQRAAFIQQARSMGYDAIDEGDHVHVEPRNGAQVASGYGEGQDPFAGRPGYVAPKPVAAPKAKRRMSPDEVVKAGYPAGSVVLVDENNDEDLKFKPESKDQPGGKALLQGTVEKLTKDAGRLDNLTNLSAAFKDDFAGNKIGGGLENYYGRIGGETIGIATEGQSDWWQRYDKHKNEVRNELFGASLTTSEQAAFEAADITPNMDPARIRANLKTQSDIIAKGLRRKGRTWAAQGYNRDAIMEATGLDSLDDPKEAPKAAPAGTSKRDAMPAKPKTQADFDRLPKGALYVDPDDGKTYRKR